MCRNIFLANFTAWELQIRSIYQLFPINKQVTFNGFMWSFTAFMWGFHNELWTQDCIRQLLDVLNNSFQNHGWFFTYDMHLHLWNSKDICGVLFQACWKIYSFWLLCSSSIISYALIVVNNITLPFFMWFFTIIQWFPRRNYR